MPLPKDLYKRLAAAKIFLDENYYLPISLGDIAKQAHLSSFHFHRLFLKTYRRTPHQYLSLKRIEMAKHLLEENLTVQEVCNEVGFESPGSFTVWFRKATGPTPKDYRSSCREKKRQTAAEPRTAIPACFISFLGM